VILAVAGENGGDQPPASGDVAAELAAIRQTLQELTAAIREAFRL
jgi:hypothetical protein